MPRAKLAYVRSKLWPTRRLFEWRHGQLTQELAAVRESIEGLKTMHSSIDGLRGELTTLRGVVEGLAVRQESIFATQAELRTRLRRTQALTARTYELLHDWPALLTAARNEEAYALAYEEAVPLVSIPIPTFNSPDTLCDRALASVRAQTHSNWEAIVVGDHCTDDTEIRVRALGEPRIRFYNLPVRENDPDDPWERWALRGSVPRSTGIELASGRWIAPLSHDDAWDADHLERLLSAARESHAEVVYSRMRVVDGERPGSAPSRSIGAWPPALGQYGWQSAMFHGGLRFLQYDRACVLASEPNDWNLARRAWAAGVRFRFLDRETSTLFVYPRAQEIIAEYAANGLPPNAMAQP